jgi:predicted MPP superfamily phosphohydrolase
MPDRQPTRREPKEPARSVLGILHLTDLHAGQKIHADIYPHMREGFFKDLPRCYKKSGPWDVVVFSGDLAFSGKEAEYQIVETFLDELYGRLRDLGSDPLLVAVPGNHDVSRPPDPTSAPVLALTSLSELPQQKAQRYWESIINNPASDGRSAIKSHFTEYSKWRASHAKIDRSLFESFTEGLLPGEFSATVEKNGCRFAILGLNSTFMQLNDEDFRGKLQMHVQQFNTLVKEDLDLLQEVDAAILITHHPPDWLQPENRTKTFEPTIAKSGRFAVHLCGHMHFPKNEMTAWGASAARRVFLGRSLLAKEKTLDGLDRILGYQALRIEIDRKSQHGVVRCWPRKVINTQSNDWIFARDDTFGELDDDDGTPSRPESLFERPNWKGPKPSGAVSYNNDAASLSRGRRRAEKPHEEVPASSPSNRTELNESPLGAKAAGATDDLATKLGRPALTKSPWPPAVVHELNRLKAEPSTRAISIANLDTAVLDNTGSFTGRYKARSIKKFYVTRPMYVLQFDFQIGGEGSFDETNFRSSVFDKNLEPLRFDSHVQELTKPGDTLRSYRAYFLFDQPLAPDSPNQPYRAEYQYEGDDPYPNLGSGLEASTITMRQGGADQAILCVAFPRSKVNGEKVVDISRATSEQLSEAKYEKDDETFVPSEDMLLFDFFESMGLGKNPTARYFFVGRRAVGIEQKQTFGFLIG